MGNGVELRVLGRIELRRAGERIIVPPGKQQAVLAVLAAASRRVASQELLTGQVWPDSTPDAATRSLHSCVYRLRRLIPASQVIGRESGDYVLDLPDDSIDLYRFEQLIIDGQAMLEAGDHGRASELLREALELWRGDSFDGIDLPLVRERARALDELRLDAAEAWLTAELELRRNEEVSRQSDALIEQHPYREKFWELSMIALYRSGRQTAALETYRRLYDLLGEELGIEPSPPLRELQQRILAGDPDLHSSRPDRRTTPIPRQLPPATRQFVGRRPALTVLDQLAERHRANDHQDGSGPLIAVLTGPAGVGKTTLALHWAHAVSEEFPDGQLYANLRGFDESGRMRPVAEVVRAFLTTLGVSDAEVPRHPDDQVAQFRTITADRRLLVVLDNARLDDQVRPLLPSGPECCVLVTSREQLAGLCATDGGQPVPLDVLDDSESLELLVNRIGADRVSTDRSSATKIIDWCRGLPLALAIAAARLASQPHLPLSGAVASLLDGGRSLDALDAGGSLGNLRQVLSWSYDTLEPESARMFRLLAVHPGPDITAAAAASLSAIEPRQTKRHLDRLVTANLLREQVPGRFQLHDLLRSYAFDLASTIDGDEGIRRAAYRVLDHYLQSGVRGVARADPSRKPIEIPEPSDGIVPENLDGDSLLRWCQTEHAVLQGCVELGLELGADSHVGAIVWSLRTHLATINPPDPELTLQLAALTAARRSGDLAAEIDSLCYLIYARANLGQHALALEDGRQALELATRLDQPRERAMVLLAVGFVHETLDHPDLVWQYNEEALHWFRQAGYEKGVAKTLNSLGWIQARRGIGADAVAYSKQACEIYERLGGDDPGHADFVDTLATGYAAMGDIENASAAFRRAIELYQRSGFSRAAGDSWVRFADLQERHGDWDSYLDALREALKAYQDTGSDCADSVRERLIRSATQRTSAVS